MLGVSADMWLECFVFEVCKYPQHSNLHNWHPIAPPLTPIEGDVCRHRDEVAGVNPPSYLGHILTLSSFSPSPMLSQLWSLCLPIKVHRVQTHTWSSLQ